MAYKTILVHVGSDDRNSERLRAAARLASAFEADLVGLFVVPPLILPAPYGNPAALLGVEAIEAQQRATSGQAQQARAAFDAACAQAGVSGEWYEDLGDAGELLAIYGRYCDLTVLGQSEAEGLAAIPRQLPERVVLGSGRPVLLVPYAGTFDTIGKRVVIAWSGTREAARAVADALPLLERAEQVIVLEIDPPDGSGDAGSQLVRRLGRHGVPAEAQHTVSAGVATGEILLSALADAGADCLVMGAYGHSRMRELALGGVTRSLLAHMTVPVLMSA